MVESPSLVIFTFHSLFASQAEIESGILDPQQGITLDMFREFINDFQAHGYQFVTARQMVKGLRPGRRYAAIVFDDGYCNNLRAVRMLEEFDVPAVFCVSTEHIMTGKSFWWDTLYREARQRKWPAARVEHMRKQCKMKRTSEAEAALKAEFGPGGLQPTCDLDRPLTTAEIAELAAHPLCSIGNHTADHAILTNYSPTEIRQQITRAQGFIQEVTGSTPDLIAYPNGDISPTILRLTREVGLRIGVTMRSGRNRVDDPQDQDKALQLRRFTLWGNRELKGQCRSARSPLSLKSAVSSLRSVRPAHAS